MSRQTSDAREFTRLKLPASVELYSASRGKLHGQVRDISMNGALVVLSDTVRPERGETLGVQMYFNGLPLSMEGRMTRCEARQVALRFVQMDIESYDLLSKIIMLNSECPERIEEELSSHLGLQQPLLDIGRHRHA